MVLALALALVLSGLVPGARAGETVAPSVATAASTPADPTWLATVRRLSSSAGSNWTLRFRKSASGAVSARIWWIEGVPVHTGMPAVVVERSGMDEQALPDTLDARLLELTVEDCRALAGVAGELEEPEIPAGPGSARPTLVPRTRSCSKPPATDRWT